MQTVNKVVLLLEIMSEDLTLNDDERYNNTMLSLVINEMNDYYLVKSAVFFALELVDEMLNTDKEPLEVSSSIQKLACKHENSLMQKLMCNAIKENIIRKYLS